MKPFNMARRGAIAAALGVALCALPQFAAAQAPAAPAAPAASGKTEILWLGQAATRIKTPGGKVIVIDPWLRTNPKTPQTYKDLDALGKVDLILVTHGHFDHFADAPALAEKHKVPMYGPAGMNAAVATLGILPAELAPRFGKGGTIMPFGANGVTRWRAGGLHHRDGEWLQDLAHGRHRPVRRHEVHRRVLQARSGDDPDWRSLRNEPRRCGGCHPRHDQAEIRHSDPLRHHARAARHHGRVCCGARQHHGQDVPDQSG